MYSPCLLNSRVPKVKWIASSHRLREVTAGAHRKETLESNQRAITLLLRGKHEQASTRRQHETLHLPSRAVTNRLSGVFVTHDDIARLYWFKLFIYSR